MTNDKIKNWLYGVLIIAILVGAYAMLVYVNAYSQSMTMRSFSVAGEAKISAKPDIAEFDFGVFTEGDKDVAVAQELNTSQMNKILNDLKSRGIKAEDIKTTGYSIEPRYQYYQCRLDGACPPSSLIGYTIHQNATIKIRDFKLIGDLLTNAVKNGANNVSKLRFTIDKRDELLAQARGEAIKNAQAKAVILARTAGFRLGDLLSVEDDYNPYPSPLYGVGGGPEMAMARVGATPIIEPGTQELTALVNLRYGIK